MTRYVAGFLMTDDLVYLVRKIKPAALTGMLNGVGGKIEPPETPETAMCREFMEETQMIVTEWRLFCHLQGSYDLFGNGQAEPFEVFFFLKHLWSSQVDVKNDSRENDVGEYMRWYHVPTLMECPNRDNLMPNCLWLIPMAQSIITGKERASRFVISERY